MQRPFAIATFVLVTAVVMLPALWFQFTWPKLDLHAALNAHHAPWSDALFAKATYLADGWAVVVVALLLLWLQGWRSFLMVGLSCGLSSLVVQFLKRVVFPDMDRPRMFLDRMDGLALVSGVDMHAHFSFPSGHSTAAFSMCLALAVGFGRKGLAAALAVLAALLAYSRIYLSQHFLEDTLAGATIGTLTACGVYWLLYRSAWSGAAWLDRRPFVGQNQ
jgi:membrane-associated phospholipid phosphatase